MGQNRLATTSRFGPHNFGLVILVGMGAVELIEGLLELRGASETPFSDPISLVAISVCSQLNEIDGLEAILNELFESRKFKQEEMGFVYGSLLLYRSGPPPSFNADSVFIDNLKEIERKTIYPWVIMELLAVSEAFDLHKSTKVVSYIASVSGKLPYLGSNKWDNLIARFNRRYSNAKTPIYAEIVSNLKRVN